MSSFNVLQLCRYFFFFSFYFILWFGGNVEWKQFFVCLYKCDFCIVFRIDRSRQSFSFCKRNKKKTKNSDLCNLLCGVSEQRTANIRYYQTKLDISYGNVHNNMYDLNILLTAQQYVLFVVVCY